MIIELSPSDPDFKKDAPALSAMYNEKACVLKPGCFDDCKDERVTLLGHASLDYYGDANFTPEQLVCTLLRFGLPRCVRTLDLIGCEIGVAPPGTKSYACRVANILHGMGYAIQINAFTSFIESKENAAMRVTALGAAFIVKDPTNFDKNIKKLLKIEKKLIDTLDSKKDIEKKESKESYAENDLTTLTIEERIKHAMNSVDQNMIDLTMLQFYDIPKLYTKHETKKLEATGNPRKILDQNLQYQFSVPEDLCRLHNEKQAVSILIGKIAQLQQASQIVHRTSPFFQNSPITIDIQHLRKLLHIILVDPKAPDMRVKIQKTTPLCSEMTKRTLDNVLTLLYVPEIELADFKKSPCMKR